MYRKLVWALDLNGVADMYESYETANLWSFITNTPEGLRVSFVRAEHSTFRWAGPEQAVISSHGHAVHTLHKSGHWVHADNPDGMHGCCPECGPLLWMSLQEHADPVSCGAVWLAAQCTVLYCADYHLTLARSNIMRVIFRLVLHAASMLCGKVCVAVCFCKQVSCSI